MRRPTSYAALLLALRSRAVIFMTLLYKKLNYQRNGVVV